MVSHWSWIAVGLLVLVGIFQQFVLFRVCRESKKRDELFRIVTENAADMIALVDVKGHRLYNSPAYKRVLGYSAAELGETSSFEQIHPDDRFKVLDAARAARETGVGQTLEYRVRHKNGSWRVLESVAGTIRNDKGEVTKLVIVNRDVTDRRRAEEQAEHNSFHDGLTGLPNRQLFLDRLEQSFERAQRKPERQYALLLVDLDDFKVFNDTMGSAVADQVIVEIGRRLGACLRDEDAVSRPQDASATKNAVLSRLGGDEFTILLEGAGDPSDAMRVGNRILAAVSALFLVEGREVRASASIGIALSTASHKRAEDLLQDADAAMRRAKALGGSRCEVFDEAMHTRAVSRLKLESELREALQQRQFRVFYQPIINLETRRIVAMEALLRWQHPQRGLISPYKFIAAAEDTGLLVFAGHWMVLEACRQLQAWDTTLRISEPLNVTVNVSVKQVADPRFVNELETALRETSLDPSRLHLEMTENVAAADPRLTATVLSQLKRLRVGVILDDFGTASWSLSSLREFPIAALKIDRVLVNGMLGDRGAADAVELVTLLAQKLKLKVIAEGIENAKQLEWLRELGCDLGQGYLFSQPVEARAAGELLRQGPLAVRASGTGA
jgi:diguanylate cyclase (GGDEF)-like protein/PAS domain S-box-containing protein